MPINRAADYVVEEEDFDINARPTQSAQRAGVEGWGDFKGDKKTGDFPVDFVFPKNSPEIQVVKFLDPSGPFYRYKSHFLTKKDGRKSYVCLSLVGDCPLCQLDPTVEGQKPDGKFAFTVANLSVNPFQRQLLTATPRLYGQLTVLDSSPQGPLSSKYWALSRTGVRQDTTYHITPIKERDLMEDWGINPTEAEEAIASMERFTPSIIRENSFAELAEIAANLS